MTVKVTKYVPPEEIQKYAVSTQDISGIPSTLEEQEFKLGSKEAEFTSVESIANFRKNSLYSIAKNLKIADSAFTNSIVCYAVSKRNLWMLDSMDRNFHQMKVKLQESVDTEDGMYDLKLWHFLSNTFEKIPDYKLRIPAENIILNKYNYKTHFTYKDGQYSADDGLAHACILKRKNPNGEGNILHLTFRGTEFSRIFEYLKGPYLDMSAYYEHFRPLEKYIRDYVSDPKNKITELHVTGHSLGGAMVQQFLKNHPAESFPVPIQGFTFGSPGSEKKWYHKFLTVAYHTLGRGLPISCDENTPKEKELRLHEFYHSNDPVPKVGLLGYLKSGVSINLFDNTYEKDKEAKIEKESFLEKVPAFGKMISYFKERILQPFNVKFHDSDRYILNLRNLIENHFENHPELGDTLKNFSQNWINFAMLEKKFSALSIKHKNMFENIVSESNPTLTPKEVNERIYEFRAKMKYDTQADIILSDTRQSGNKYDRFLRTGKRTPEEEEQIRAIINQINAIATQEQTSRPSIS